MIGEVETSNGEFLLYFDSKEKYQQYILIYFNRLKMFHINVNSNAKYYCQSQYVSFTFHMSFFWASFNKDWFLGLVFYIHIMKNDAQLFIGAFAKSVIYKLIYIVW